MALEKITIIPAVLLLVGMGAAWQDSVAQSARQPSRVDNIIPATQSDVDSAHTKGSACIFDFEVGEVSNCIRRKATGDLFVVPEVLKKLNFASDRLAPVLSPNEGWMYVNRQGKVVVSGVPSMDNWADSFHDGLVRIVRNEKYGFANRKGQLVIPAIYDGAMNFEQGRADVCKGCKSKCADQDCEHHYFAGGEWFRIDTRGAVLARLNRDD